MEVLGCTATRKKEKPFGDEVEKNKLKEASKSMLRTQNNRPEEQE